MEEFDPMRVNTYSINQLADMISAGIVTIEDVYAVGLMIQKRAELENELNRRRMVVVEDDEAWEVALRKHTVPGYESYLRRYDKFPPEYRGKHVAEAKALVEELRDGWEKLRAELFDEMKKAPWLYKNDVMKKLFRGVSNPEELELLRDEDDAVSRFLASGQKITYRELVDNKIITDRITKEALESPDQMLQQTNVKDLLPFPTERRTEVYFFGVPRGGKSSVLAGILSNMYKRGVSVYEPHYNSYNTDMVRPYYNGLINSTETGKFPVSTAADAVTFMKFTLCVGKRENKLTFVELGGEAFRQAAECGKRGIDAWEGLGAGEVLASSNKKLLVFILDYAIKKGINKGLNETKQAHILDTALSILASDGTGADGSRGCTLSKVDTVAVVVTKCDLMNESDLDKRNQLAMEYVSDTFAAFMTNLHMKCEKFRINRPVGYNPYVIAFSLGKLFVGNTYQFDPTDSRKLVNFISDVTEGKRTGWFGNVFG